MEGPVKIWIEDLYEERFGEGGKKRKAGGTLGASGKNVVKVAANGIGEAAAVPWPTDADVPAALDTCFERDWAKIIEFLNESA